VYLREKGISMPLETVDIVSGQNRTPEFLKKNPLGGLPILDLEDGSYLTESLVIIEYLEDLHPDPPMIGKNPLERARVREFERFCEISVLSNAGTIFQNTHLAERLKQSADAADNARTRLANNLRVLDARIQRRPFVAGDRPTIADCTLVAAALSFAEFAGVQIEASCHNVAHWYATFQKRPSTVS
jgi:glutathione S-transferase